MNKSSQEKVPSHILIVEDDDLMDIFYKRLFREHAGEFVCQFESNAKDAMKHLLTGKIALVILDWDMPGISGLDLLKAIRANPVTKLLRVLIVSGRTHIDDQLLALKSGADDYLSKPFHLEVFLARIRGLLRR